MNQKIDKILSQIGLNDIEKSIYLTCLQYGLLGITTMARLLHLPRTTVNDRVEKLSREGILIQHKASKGHKFSAANANDMINNLYIRNQKNTEIIKEIDENKEAWDKAMSTKDSLPKVKFYEGGELFNIIHAKVQQAGSGCFITNIDSVIEYTKWSIPKLVDEFFLGKKSVVRELVFDTPIGRKYAAGMKKKGHYVKLWPVKDHEKYASNICLVEGFYYHMTFGNIISAVEIQNDIYYQTNLLFFNTLREGL